jgi:hypothetical protein
MSPDAPTPAEFGGECAFSVSLGKRGVAGREGCYAIRDGRKFVFSNAVARLLWLLIPGRRRASERNWASRQESSTKSVL